MTLSLSPASGQTSSDNTSGRENFRMTKIFLGIKFSISFEGDTFIINFIYRFLVLIHPLKICSPLNNNEAPILGHTKIQKTMSEDDRKRLFTDIFETFLSEDSDDVLPLSNQALWADLLATFNALQSKEPVTNESLNKILQVRKDPGIWDDGLEPTYMRFLKQAPPPTLAACILSIL